MVFFTKNVLQKMQMSMTVQIEFWTEKIDRSFLKSGPRSPSLTFRIGIGIGIEKFSSEEIKMSVEIF